MWLNKDKINDFTTSAHRNSLAHSCPNHIVIDGLFNEAKLDEVIKILQQPQNWQTQQHTYSALYVDNTQWQNTSNDQRFVQRDVWRRGPVSSNVAEATDVKAIDVKTIDIKNSAAEEFLLFLRGDEFMSVLSRIFNVQLTDMNVSEPGINTNYFRLSATDFVEQHADDSPGREVCLLLYLNKQWNNKAGGELGFTGKEDQEPINIQPLYNRCVLFNPSSQGSEHWVERLNAEYADKYRYNVTSWYWSE